MVTLDLRTLENQSIGLLQRIVWEEDCENMKLFTTKMVIRPISEEEIYELQVEVTILKFTASLIIKQPSTFPHKNIPPHPRSCLGCLCPSRILIRSSFKLFSFSTIKEFLSNLYFLIKFAVCFPPRK